jgi:hypothetical protein
MFEQGHALRLPRIIFILVSLIAAPAAFADEVQVAVAANSTAPVQANPNPKLAPYGAAASALPACLRSEKAKTIIRSFGYDI